MTDDGPDEPTVQDGRAADAAAERSAVSDELDVPDRPPNPDETPHVLSDGNLRYPEFEFEEGEMASNGGFDLERTLDREELGEWIDDLAAGLESHDVAVSTADEIAVFGVGSGDASVSFEPDDEHAGTLEVTFSLNAKLMTFSDDPDERRADARAGEGFVPLEMLASDADPESFRCYNWIDDPVDRS